MRTFEHFNKKTGCIICGKTTDTPPVLIAIDGTGDGKIAEAEQVHLECLDLSIAKNFNGTEHLIYQRFETPPKE